MQARGTRMSSLVARDRISHPPAEPLLDRVARQVNEICRCATFDLSLRIGAVIINELYDGSIELWEKEGSRRPMYRKLAARGDLLLSPSGLCRAVAVHALCERLGGRARWRHLSTSHLQEILPLDRPQQERLIQIAEAERWTVAQLRSEVLRRR